MSQFIKTDVGDFFVNRTKNFEKSPPDSMWESIERQIPKYPVTDSGNSLIKYLIAGISLSVIVMGILLIYYQNISTPGEKSKQSVSNTTDALQNTGKPVNVTLNTATAINKTVLKNIVPVKKETENTSFKSSAANTNQNEKNTDNINSAKNNEDFVQHGNTSNKTIIYSINATGLKDVTEIYFENNKEEKVIIVKNPVPNAFGFFEIDISKLAGGTYKVWIVSQGNKKFHKTETFK